MTPEQMGQFLDELGKRLTPAGSHIFELAVRQELILGAVGFVVAITLTGVVIACLVAAIKYRKHFEDFSGPVLMVAFVFGVMMAIVWAYALPLLLNPEYAALSDILSKIRP